MTVVAFDTHAQIKQLVQTGIPEAQAEAFVNVVAGATVLPDVSKLATKDDLSLLKAEVTQLRTELKADSAQLRSELKADLAQLRTELVSDTDKLRLELRGDIKGLKGELIWWILGAVGFTAALPPLLAHLPK